MTHRQMESARKKLIARGIACRVEMQGDYAALIISGADVALAMHVAPAIRAGFARPVGTTEVAYVSTMRGAL